MNKIYYIPVILLIFTLSQIVFVPQIFAQILPKTKDLKKTESTELRDKTNTDPVEIEKESEEEVGDQVQFYKLIAIYLINNKPRALIKNVTTPEEAAKEYQVGDYLDESQTLSISKITLTPTTRIELTDLNGLSYLIKPSVGENKGASGSSASSKSYFGSKASPSRFSGSSSKSRAKKPSEGTTPPSDTTSTSQEKKEEQGAVESAVKKEETASVTKQGTATTGSASQTTTSTSLQSTSTSKESSTNTQAAETKPSSTPKSSDSLGVDRPTDAYGVP